MSDYRNDDENKELTGQTMSDNHKTEDKHEDEYEKYWDDVQETGERGR